MTSFIFLFLFSTSAALAGGEKISSPVDITSPLFAEKITKALEKNTKPKSMRRVGGSSLVYEVDTGLECSKNTALISGGKTRVSYACRILPTGGWRYLGSESYGSGDNEKFSLALYKALELKEEKEQGVAMKTIELNQNDPRGGTERNLLTCTLPVSKQAKEFIRPTCQLLNAL